MSEFEDLTGKRYQRLVVMNAGERSKWRERQWMCRCDCGNDTLVRDSLLRNGKTGSCGCIRRENNSKMFDHVKKSGAIGGRELKMTKEILTDMKSIRNANSTIQQKDLVKIIHKKYPQFAEKSIPGYICGCYTSERVFQMYLDDKLSFGVLRVLGGCDPQSLGDFLADEFIDRKMSIGELEEARSLMRKKEVKSWDEAIKVAMGKIVTEIKPPSDKRTRNQIGVVGSVTTEAPRSFEDLLNEVVVMGTNWRLKVQMAIDMAPFVADRGQHNFTVFNKIYMLRHTLKENFEFVDKKVKEYLDAMLSKGNVAPVNGSDADITAMESFDETADGSGSERGGREDGRGAVETVAEGNGQVVPPADARVIQGEGRVR